MINALSKNGKLIVVHSCGNDPGQELINKIWPKEKPFPSLAKEIYLDLKRNFDTKFIKSFKLNTRMISSFSHYSSKSINFFN